MSEILTSQTHLIRIHYGTDVDVDVDVEVDVDVDADVDVDIDVDAIQSNPWPIASTTS